MNQSIRTLAKDSFLGQSSKKGMVVLLRWILIIGCSSVILFGGGEAKARGLGQGAVLTLILSNVFLASLPRRIFLWRYFDHLLAILDIALLSICFYFSGQVAQELYLLYFVVIMIAAAGETLRSVLWSASLVALVYVGLLLSKGGITEVLTLEVLLRIPFLFIVAMFFGYFAQRVREEQQGRNLAVRELSRATRMRSIVRALSSSLERGTLLELLVRHARDFTHAEYACVLSRGSTTILEQAGPIPLGDASAIFGKLAAEGADTPESSERVHFFPLTGKDDSDLYLAIVGEFQPEVEDYLSILLLQAQLALHNAGQYQELQHEIEKRQEVNRQLTEALQFKSEFVANISHEIRTPIYSFIGFAELLVAGGYGRLSDEQQGAIERMLENSKHLLELINNILDHARLESGIGRGEASAGSMQDFVRDIAETCIPLLKDKPLSLHAEVQRGFPVIRMDWTVLRQIVLNLVSNALKFTAKGKVLVHAAWIEASQEILIRVEDTGVGIPEGKLELIFEAFRQLENSYTKKYAGTGLGLSLTKKQVEVLGGEIQVSSKLNVGSVFTVRIPVELALNENPEPEALQQPELSKESATIFP